MLTTYTQTHTHMYIIYISHILYICYVICILYIYKLNARVCQIVNTHLQQWLHDSDNWFLRWAICTSAWWAWTDSLHSFLRPSTFLMFSTMLVFSCLVYIQLRHDLSLLSFHLMLACSGKLYRIQHLICWFSNWPSHSSEIRLLF